MRYHNYHKPSLRPTRSYEWKTTLALRMIPQSFTTRTCQSYRIPSSRKTTQKDTSYTLFLGSNSEVQSDAFLFDSALLPTCTTLLNGLRCMRLQLSTRHLLSAHETLTEQYPIAKVVTRPAFLIASIPWSFPRHVT